MEAGARARDVRMVYPYDKNMHPGAQEHKRASIGCPSFLRLAWPDFFGAGRLRSTHERGAPAAFVVITTTPYDASGPYCLSAACPLITRISEICSGVSDGT